MEDPPSQPPSPPSRLARVVTVSRQYGAGGRRVAEALASALGYTLVDREVVEEAAVKAGIDPETASGLDERTPSLIEEIGLALAAASPELGITLPRPDDRVLAREVMRAMESMAQTGGYVILGRGGQAALATHSGVCHLQVVGRLEDRVRRIAEWQMISLDHARDRCRHIDAERAAYLRRFYDADINDVRLYDVVLNTSRLGLDGALAVALAAARAGGAS